MHIALNEELTPQTNVREFDISHKITSLAYSQHRLEKDFTYQVIDGHVQSTLRNYGLMGLVSHCYSNHLPLAIAPHDVWILLMSEITKEIAKNPEQYRQFFTKSDKKETICVPSGSMTQMPMDVLSQALAQKVLFDSTIILQDFSTQTPMVAQTIQAIFCDMASPFYDYGMFMCGIPSIELLGTLQDWQKVLTGFTQIVNVFNTTPLKNYLEKARPILEQFINALNGDADTQFWRDIFTQKNVGSGGDLQINGWITSLFVQDQKFAKITNFTDTHGVVKYKQLQSNEEFVAVYGGFHAQVNHKGSYQLEYSHYTLKKVPYKRPY